MSQREIKFRGKRLFADEWVFGSLIVKLDGSMDIYVEEKDGTVRTYQVKPESVGEWTGLEDRDGVEIYENDRVRCAHGNCRVEFGKWVSNNRNNDDILGWMVMGEYSAHPLDPQAAYWVIGSTSETPELLKTATS